MGCFVCVRVPWCCPCCARWARVGIARMVLSCALCALCACACVCACVRACARGCVCCCCCFHSSQLSFGWSPQRKRAPKGNRVNYWPATAPGTPCPSAHHPPFHLLPWPPQVALLAGVTHTGLWLRYQYLVRDRPYAKRGATIIILLNAAILLEVSAVSFARRFPSQRLFFSLYPASSNISYS